MEALLRVIEVLGGWSFGTGRLFHGIRVLLVFTQVPKPEHPDSAV